MTSGGKERRLTELMKQLNLYQNIEFELVVMSNEIHYEEVYNLNIRVHYIVRRCRKDIFAFKKFYTLCKRFRPDIIHCWDSMTAIYAIPSCLLLKIKLVNGLVVDSPSKRSVFNKYMLRARFSFLFSDLIIGNSNAGMNAYRTPKSKSMVIYNGFNFNRTNGIIPGNFMRNELAIDTKYVIGMVASFSKFKDYGTFYNAAKLLLSKRKDITFITVGNNTDHQSSLDLIDEEYRRNFRFLGNRSDVENIISSMDVCVLSTFTEGISNSILEYMALGKPVIATMGGGTIEILQNNITGFLVNPSNPDELAEKAELLLNNEQLRIKMGTAGKERAKSNFSIDAMINKYIDGFNRVMAAE
jgi:glycosyltransferase involved in cell wall biosynthesis